MKGLLNKWFLTESRRLLPMLNNNSNISVYKCITKRTYTARRALMYVPGNDERKLTKAFNLDVDCIAMDCEDGVALNKKEEARTNLRSILDQGKPVKKKQYDLGVRVNSISSGLCEKDLEQLLTARHLPDTVLLPKVDSSSDIKWFSDRIGRLIKGNDKVNLVIYIESPIAFINLVDICKTATELSLHSKFLASSLVFGSDDLCASLGVTRTDSSIEILYARQKMVLVAKAFGLQAIDMVYIKFKDLEGLERQCLEGARMGYTGKQVIHPGQIDVVQKTFIPTQGQIEWARGLMGAFENHQKSGVGAFTYEGSMIDMPTVKQAKNIIELASQI